MMLETEFNVDWDEFAVVGVEQNVLSDIDILVFRHSLANAHLITNNLNSLLKTNILYKIDYTPRNYWFHDPIMLLPM